MLAPHAVPRLQPPEGTRPGPRPQSSHPPCALAPGPPRRPSRAALRAQAGAAPLDRARAPAASAQAPCPRTRPRVALLAERPALGAGLRAVLELRFHRDFRASAAFLTSRRAQRCSGWSDTSQTAAVTPALRLPFRFRAVLPLRKVSGARLWMC